MLSNCEYLDFPAEYGIAFMQEFFRHLPSPLILGTLVGIFISIYRHNRTSRVRYWIVAWTLVFVHFLVPILEMGPPRLNFLLDAIDSTTLQWAGLAFVFSLAPLRLSERNRWLCFVAVAVPLGVFSYFATSQSAHKLPQAICLAAMSIESLAVYVLFASRREWVDAAAEFFVFGVGIASIWQLYHGNPDGPYNAVMMATYALAGIFVIRHYWRHSPGVLVTSVGLFAWAAVWCGAAYFIDGMMRLADGGAEIWNVPKFIVAFGMILVLLEDESLAAQSARAGRAEDALTVAEREILQADGGALLRRAPRRT